MGPTFETAKEAESSLRVDIERNGIAGLENFALFVYSDKNDEVGECIAEGGAMLTELTSRRHIEELIEKIDSALPNLEQESRNFIERYAANFARLKLPDGLETESWIQGFLAAALHQITIDVDANEIDDYLIQTVTIHDDLQLQKAG